MAMSATCTGYMTDVSVNESELVGTVGCAEDSWSGNEDMINGLLSGGAPGDGVMNGTISGTDASGTVDWWIMSEAAGAAPADWTGTYDGGVLTGSFSGSYTSPDGMNMAFDGSFSNE